MEAIKIKLESGKEVILRKPEVGDQELAAERTADISNPNAYQLALQNELVRLLLHSVDGKKLSGNEKQDLKSLFDLTEYSEVIMGLGEMLPKPKAPKVSVVTLES